LPGWIQTLNAIGSPLHRANVKQIGRRSSPVLVEQGWKNIGAGLILLERTTAGSDHRWAFTISALLERGAGRSDHRGAFTVSALLERGAGGSDHRWAITVSALLLR